MYRPSLLDHIPKTRRGHGAAHFHGDKKVEDTVMHVPQTCVQPTCSLMLGRDKEGKQRGELHNDQKANAADWKIAHGLYSVNKQGDVYALDIPFEECFR